MRPVLALCLIALVSLCLFASPASAQCVHNGVQVAVAGNPFAVNFLAAQHGAANLAAIQASQLLAAQQQAAQLAALQAATSAASVNVLAGVHGVNVLANPGVRVQVNARPTVIRGPFGRVRSVVSPSGRVTNFGILGNVRSR